MIAGQKYTLSGSFVKDSLSDKKQKVYDRLEDVMNIRDFIDLKRLQEVQDNFSVATGFAAITVDNDGEYLTEGSNFTDFCTKYARGSEFGKKAGVENEDTYFYNLGLINFSIDIMIGEEKVGAVIGGQVLTSPLDEDEAAKKAAGLGVDADAYIKALSKVPVKTEQQVHAAAELFGAAINHLVTTEYLKNTNGGKLGVLSEEIKHANEVIQKINTNTRSLNSIANKQKMLSLNASIEAARSGEAGVGFAVVAKSMGNLSSQSATIYSDIEKSVVDITSSIEKLASLFED